MLIDGPKDVQKETDAARLNVDALAGCLMSAPDVTHRATIVARVSGGNKPAPCSHAGAAKADGLHPLARGLTSLRGFPMDLC